MSVEIDDTDDLRRHINPDHFHDDGTVSLAAYKTTNMSLDLGRLRDLEASKNSRPGWGMTEFKASVPRGCGLTVEYTPIKDSPDEPDNDSHCEIPGKIKEGQAKKLRNAHQIVYNPKSAS